MNLTLKIWRQKGANAKGKMVDYQISDISPDMSFLEMLDVLNTQLIEKGDEPVAFDHDCREGICGSCSLYINGEAHGPDRLITTCQWHIRKFKDGDTIYIEPWRASAFPVIKDLIVGDGAKEEIKLLSNKLGLLETKIVVKDSVIFNLNERVMNFESMLNTQSSQIALSKELNDKLQLDLKKQKVKTKLTTGAGILVAAGILLLAK